LLAKQQTIVTGSFEFKRREFVVRAFRFLHAKDVGLLFLEPTEDQGQASNNRVDVPGSDLHFL
jgi:hypothetical protein